MSKDSRPDHALECIEAKTWEARVPLEIRLSPSESRSFDRSDGYMILVPRISYLPFMLPRLLAYYSDQLIEDAENLNAETGFFSFEGVALKWQLPVGLLYDIYILSTRDVNRESSSSTWTSERRAEPFRLTVHFSQASSLAKGSNLISPVSAIVHDTFINSVKEADFLRSGTAKPIMSLSATESKLLWTSTKENDSKTFSRIHSSLLPTSTPWRNIPLRVYLPSTTDADTAELNKMAEESESTSLSNVKGQIRVVQAQIPCYASIAPGATTSQLRNPNTGQSNRQTIGTALHTLLPNLFPSRRTPILAKPLLHGAVVPMGALLDELASRACYADGWINVVVAISG